MFNRGATNFKLEIFKIQVGRATRRANCTRVRRAVGINAHGHLPRLIRPSIGSVGKAAFEAVLIQ